MVKRTLVVVLSFALFVILAPTLVEANPIITAPFATVGGGDTFTIPISIYDAVDLTSWQFDLAFNGAIVQANSVTEGPFMSAFGGTLFTPGVIDNTTGLISLIADSYVDIPPNPSGGGVLAYIGFTALSPGESPLTLSNVFLNLSDQGFNVGNGGVSVSVPEPSTLMLLASGLALLGLRQMARRGRRDKL